MDPRLGDDVRYLPGVGARRAGLLRKLGVETVHDLLHHLPRRHEDRRSFRPIAALGEGDTAILRGKVVSIRSQRIRGRRSYVTARVADDSGEVEVRWWNQPWIARNLPPGTELVLSGKVRDGRISAAEYEVLRDDPALHVGRIVPVYPLTKGLSGPGLRRTIAGALERTAAQLPDPLPEDIRARHDLPALDRALRDVHLPPDYPALGRALK
ncbi:MAG: OB-fold nucleic acid binding domain-containing protein, partial [Planctomycetota bacterium]